MLKVKAKTSFMDSSTGFVAEGSVIEVDDKTMKRIASLVDVLDEPVDVTDDGTVDFNSVDDVVDPVVEPEPVVEDAEVQESTEDATDDDSEDPEPVVEETEKPKRGRKPKSETPPVEA